MEAPEPQGPQLQSQPSVELALMPGVAALPDDMMGRFEALSRAFKAEVEGLVDQEKTTSKETEDQLRQRISDLEDQAAEEMCEAQLIAAKVQDFVCRRQPGCLARVFGSDDIAAEPQVTSVAELRVIADAFVAVNDAEQSPQLIAALQEIDELKAAVQISDEDIAALQTDLREARVLKSQEERDLIEFKSLRDKDSELQAVGLKLAQAESQLEELQSTQKVLSARAAQTEASVSAKTRKILELVRQLEEQTEQSRLLANENNTLRLQLGKDSDFIKVVSAQQDPLSYNSASGQLSEELAREERRFREELAVLQYKFPGLLTGSDNCRGWCGVQLAKQSSLYKSFLHLFQDMRQDSPAGAEIEFVSKTKEVDAAWTQREEEMRGQDAVFHEQEKAFTKTFEERRLKLVEERDLKIKQLLEQTERSQSKAEKQLLMQQAKLFGQRMDTQIERLWEEQRSARDARWAEHSKVKQESRQKFKDESLSVQNQADGAATATDRFQDMAQAKLGSVEDAWHRNLDKEQSISATVLKGNDLVDCLKAAGYDKSASSLPREGSLHAGVADIVEVVEHVTKHRISVREKLRSELETQTFKQLGACAEKFLQKESAQTHRSASGHEEEKTPDYSQAAVMKELLQARQHRVVGDTIRRQYHDYLLVLRLACLSAARLLPVDAVCSALKTAAAKLDLPPVPPELAEQAAAAVEASVSSSAEVTSKPEDIDAEAAHCEERFLYDSLMRRLLEQVLTPLHAEQREELLSLKRANAREIRTVLENLCQAESAVVDAAINADLEEYKAQVKAKLLSDCEYTICEERRQLNEQVEENLTLHMGKYEREAADEERAALKERRKWLTERIVVMQSQGVTTPGDKAVMHHLRKELRACELRYEMREQQAIAAGCHSSAPASHDQHQRETIMSNQASTPSLFSSAPQAAMRPPAGEDYGYSAAPVPPVGPAPQQRRPNSRTTSPSPAPIAREQQDQQQHSHPFSIGRASGTPREPAVLHFPATPSMASSSPRNSARQAQTSTSVSDRCPAPSATLSQADAGTYLQQASPRRAVVGRGPGGDSPSFGADGAAGFGRLDLHQMEDAYSVMPWDALKLGSPQCLPANSPPLYEWPFEMQASSPAMTKGAAVDFVGAGEGFGCGPDLRPQRGLSGPGTPRGKGMPEVLPALRHHSPSGNAGAAVQGYGHMQSPSACLKSSAFGSSRGMPPLLPPMSTPRGHL